MDLNERLERIEALLVRIADALEEKPKRKKSEITDSAPSSLIWSAFATAFEKRYGVKPERNASTNAMLKGIVGRIPKEDHIALAEFFVAQNDSWYTLKMHHVSCLAKDCEILLTRMRSKIVMTSSKAKINELASDNFETSKNFLRKKYGDING